MKFFGFISGAKYTMERAIQRAITQEKSPPVMKQNGTLAVKTYPYPNQSWNNFYFQKSLNTTPTDIDTDIEAENLQEEAIGKSI